MISRIKIKNFKAFKEAEINLTTLNLFTGMNGMGKSSFIQSLLLLRQSDANIIPEIKGLQLKGEIIDVGKGKDAHSINADSDIITFEVDFNYKRIVSVSYKFVAENDVLPFDKSNTNNLITGGNHSLFNSNFKYLKAERIPPYHNYKANLSAVQNGFIGYRGENTSLYIALNKLEQLSIESVKLKTAKADNLISHIDAWLNEITPGTHVISTYYNELDVVKLGYQFDYGKDDVTPQFSPMNVGFGFTYTLPVITAILSAKKGDLLIIENPESHLHPQGQAKLGELIGRAANDGVQLIIESHSDHLFNGIRVAVKNQLISSDDVSIFYFVRDQNSLEHTTKIEQPIIDSNGRISHKPTGFFDEYSKQLDELIK